MHLVGAQFSDLVELLRSSNQLTLAPARYRALISQVALGESYAIYEHIADLHPATIAGIAPFGDDAGEIWFGVKADGLGSLLLPVVREARAVIEARADAYPGGLMCLVADGHEPGERLARLIGCVPQCVFLGRHREWTWVSSRKLSAVEASSNSCRR